MHTAHCLTAPNRGAQKEGDLHVVARYSLISNALKLQRAGLGCVLGLESPTLPLVPQGFVFVPLADAASVPNYVVTKRGQIFSAATRAFLETLRGLTAS